jgi:hypothetical protein
VEPFGRAAGPVASLAGEAGPHLDPGALQHLAQAQLLGRPGETEERQRAGLVETDPGEPGAVAAVEPVTARRPADRPHRHPGRGQRLDVALHGALADLQQPRQLRPVRPPPHLQVQQQRHHP